MSAQSGSDPSSPIALSPMSKARFARGPRRGGPRDVAASSRNSRVVGLDLDRAVVAEGGAPRPWRPARAPAHASSWSRRIGLARPSGVVGLGTTSPDRSAPVRTATSLSSSTAATYGRPEARTP